MNILANPLPKCIVEIQSRMQNADCRLLYLYTVQRASYNPPSNNNDNNITLSKVLRNDTYALLNSQLQITNFL